MFFDQGIDKVKAMETVTSSNKKTIQISNASLIQAYMALFVLVQKTRTDLAKSTAGGTASGVDFLERCLADASAALAEVTDLVAP